MKEEPIENYFEAPRRSSRKVKSARTNNDMNYYEYLPRPKIQRFQWQIPTVIDTDVKPLLLATKDHTLGVGRLCSVKKCYNRHSKDLSFFGYPNDLEQRKIWILKCGLEVDPNEKKIINRYRICGAHFDEDCFKNIKLKNRLKPGAIPTLFLYNDIIDARNIPSTSSSGNCGNVHVNDVRNIPSTSSSGNGGNVYVNDVRNIPSTSSSGNGGNVHVNDVRNIPSTSSSGNGGNVYVNDVRNIPSTSSSGNGGNVHVNDVRNIPSTSSSGNGGNVHVNDVRNIPSTSSSINTGFAHDFEPYCSIPGCITNTDLDNADITLYTPSVKCVNKWSQVLGLQLTLKNNLCERHFRPEDMHSQEILVNGLNKVVKTLVPFALPIPFNAVRSASNAGNNLSDKCSSSNTSMSIDDISTIESNLKQKLKNISANNSLSITLEPIKNSKVIKPSADSFSEMSAKSSVSITLEPKLKNKFSSSINKSYPSVSLPSMDEGITKDFKVEDSGFIFEISKSVELPSLFWKTKHITAKNETTFYQQNKFKTIVKKVDFYNSLVPIITIYNKKYEFNTPIKSKNQLKRLLQQIHYIEKC